MIDKSTLLFLILQVLAEFLWNINTNDLFPSEIYCKFAVKFGLKKVFTNNVRR